MNKKLLMLLAAFSFTVLHADSSEQPHNVAVGSRILSEEERASLAMERELVEVSEKEDQLVQKNLFSFKQFYQLHYAAFHHPFAFAIDGSTLELEDGSIWMIKYISDFYVILGWQARDSLVIERFGYSGLEYKITNQTLNQSVIAAPILGPLYLGNNTHWIVSKDTFWGTLTLEDGSEWTPYFSNDTKNWFPTDTVIMGSYESVGSYNTILININLLDCVRVKLDNKKN